MSKKRSQRKNSNYNYRPGQKAGEDPQALQENSRTKKFSPAARNGSFSASHSGPSIFHTPNTSPTSMSASR